MEEKIHHPHHPWIARLVVSAIMIALGFIGLVTVDLYKSGAWAYWRIMVPVFAVLCLWLSWYLRRKDQSMSAVKILHEILHWFGLFLAVYLISIFVHLGLMGRFEAGLVVLTLLALTTFIAGIYIEVTFLVIGLMLGAFAAGASLVSAYLYTVMLPIALLGILLIAWIAYRNKKSQM